MKGRASVELNMYKRISKTPIYHRTFVIHVVLAMGLVATSVSAQETTAIEDQETLTVEDAVSIAIHRPEADALVQQRIAVERARLAASTTRANPRLGLHHERIVGAPAVADSETSLTLEQSFDLTDWRGRLAAALPHREAAARAEMDGWRLDVAQGVRAAFYAVRYREARVVVLRAWIVRLQAGVEAASAREEAGDVSGYDVRRVQRELGVAQAALASEHAALGQAWSDFETWVPGSERPTLVGDLAPAVDVVGDLAPAVDVVDDLAPAVDVVATPVRRLPDLVRLESLAAASAAESEAWRAPFLRDWSVEGGYRLAQAGGAPGGGSELGHGFSVGLSIPLILRNPDRARVALLAAESDALHAELQWARSIAEQAATAGQARLADAVTALASLPAPDDDRGLTHMAEVAYRAGEASLTELLDAYESESELQLSRLELEWEARQAAIELERFQGLGMTE